MTVCKKCGGSGWDDEHMIKCLHCHGSGEVEMTNEEWFNGLTTEEKAKRIINIAVNSDCDYRTIVEWLKEKHE